MSALNCVKCLVFIMQWKGENEDDLLMVLIGYYSHVILFFCLFPFLHSLYKCTTRVEKDVEDYYLDIVHMYPVI